MIGKPLDPRLRRREQNSGSRGVAFTVGEYRISPLPSGEREPAVPVFDIANYMSGHRTGRGDILVTGFVGIFVDAIVAGDVRGYLTTIDFDPSGGNLSTNTSSFLRTVILVR